MLFKSIAALAAVGLVSAQTANYTHGAAHLKNAVGVEAFFTFDLTAEGMKVDYNATGLNTTYAILPQVGFEYHIHVDAVPASGDCMATGLHLDPLNVGTAKPCDPKNLTTCQVGDLSGKHGNILPTADGVIAPNSYTDSALVYAGPASGSILGRSVVIHNNGTRIACANLIVDGYVAPSASASGSSPSATGSNPPKSTSGAVKLVGSVALSGVIAVMMLAL
ncbi:hypothetical protein EMPS_02144 [Entomortierella parvispora]|uniref:Superoxide dismutase copper/zinc binding domain-containing protein n=1 Tax=Entomortierella parvispora TaxID=205924 RepID=A0A9P3H484_9FUNG|nr:hypothetical protein EMPS_02144 [Entomortierella parvispora]